MEGGQAVCRQARLGSRGFDPHISWYSAALDGQSHLCQNLQAWHKWMHCLLF